MLKKFLYSLITFVFASSVFALEVNENEIKSVGDINNVVFENYSGPHSIINTIEEIKAIGTGLGKAVSTSITEETTVGNSKYSVIHCVDPKESGKLDADILILGKDAAVDHIKNLRRIIAAYLTAAYGYSDKDADTVATFVTVYNAVYRGRLDTFESKYKKVVTNKLTKDKAGLALSYKEWPGNSQIVIPLSDLSGGLSTVDTSVISDKQVVESMQGEDDKSIDTRKEMVDIKEREADAAAEKAKEAQKKATEEANKLKEEQQKAADAKKQAEEAKKQAEQAQQKAQENPNDKQAQQDAQEKASQAQEKQQAADEQSKKVEEQSQRAQQASQEASNAQTTADTKRSEAQNERTTIAQDQQTLIREEQKNAGATIVYGLKNVDELGVMSEVVKVNGDTGELLKESPVSVVRTRTFYEVSDGFIAIAGTNIGNGAIKLVKLDKDKMEIIKESNETLSETSVLVQDGSSYYCVVQDGASYYVGKYNANLELQLKSPVQVKASTPITITSKGILVTSLFGKPILLKTNDLTQIGDTYNPLDFSNAK